MRQFISILLIFFCTSTLAEPRDWMKQKNADQLGLFVSANSCPFTDSELQRSIEGEYLRARIKATNNTNFNITLTALCLDARNTNGTLIGKTLYYEIRFGTKIPDGDYVLYETPNYGSLNTLGKNSRPSDFISLMKNSVENAITDYLQANFS